MRTRLSETQSQVDVGFLTHGKMDSRSNRFRKSRLLDMKLVKADGQGKQSVSPHIVGQRNAYDPCIHILGADFRSSHDGARWIRNCAEDSCGILSPSRRGETK